MFWLWFLLLVMRSAVACVSYPSQGIVEGGEVTLMKDGRGGLVERIAQDWSSFLNEISLF